MTLSIWLYSACLTLTEHPELLDVQRQKDESLHTMLKGMVVNPEKVTEVSILW